MLEGEFRALFDAHGVYVMKSLRRLGVRPGDVEDLTHEVFLTVLRKWDTYDATRPPRPWLFAFALRMASAYRQSAYVRREGFETTERADRGKAASAESLLVERQESALVYRALEALDYDKRVVFTMFELDERTAADIAAELDIPQNTVFSRLRAAREEFTQAAKRLTREPPRPPHPQPSQEPRARGERPRVD
jgi:RNA polymerase sigma-70 factor (ECF subfamily)